MITERHTLRHNEPNSLNSTPIPRTEGTFMIYGSACRRREEKKEKEKALISLRGAATKRSSFAWAPFETRNPTPFALTASERSQKECSVYTFNLPPLPKRGLWKFSQCIGLLERWETPTAMGMGWWGESCLGASGRCFFVCVCVCFCMLESQGQTAILEYPALCRGLQLISKPSFQPHFLGSAGRPWSHWLVWRVEAGTGSELSRGSPREEMGWSIRKLVFGTERRVVGFERGQSWGIRSC